MESTIESTREELTKTKRCVRRTRKGRSLRQSKVLECRVLKPQYFCFTASSCYIFCYELLD